MKRVVVGWGRFNPPTIGHGKLIQMIVDTANGDDWFLYPSHTHPGKKDSNNLPGDPLTADRKNYWLKKMFPNHASNIVYDPQVKTIIQLFQKFQQDYDEFILVCGDDQYRAYLGIQEKYNGVEFTYRSMNVINAGKRDPNAEGATGMSATKMRLAARNMDFISFRNGIPTTVSDIDCKKLRDEVRKGMGL